MIICVIGWFLWCCVQVFMACFTPFRHLMLKGKRYSKVDSALRYMNIQYFRFSQ